MSHCPAPSPDTQGYLSPEHLQFFCRKLEEQRQRLLAQLSENRSSMQVTDRAGNDLDRACLEQEWTQITSRSHHGIHELERIERALRRIDLGDYGYCEDTGEPIGLNRLLAEPTACLCLEAQRRREHRDMLLGRNRSLSGLATQVS